MVRSWFDSSLVFVFNTERVTVNLFGGIASLAMAAKDSDILARLERPTAHINRDCVFCCISRNGCRKLYGPTFGLNIEGIRSEIIAWRNMNVKHKRLLRLHLHICGFWSAR